MATSAKGSKEASSDTPVNCSEQHKHHVDVVFAEWSLGGTCTTWDNL
jgi:hypothetical protein